MDLVGMIICLTRSSHTTIVTKPVWRWHLSKLCMGEGAGHRWCGMKLETGSCFGPDLIKESEDKGKLIRDRLKVAQSRQKSYADSKRKEVTYEIGDRAYLWVSPLRGVKRFGVKGKLAPRFVGPYRVLERMGEVAYKLELPEGLSGIHDVFHVS